jgi:hypothetical protein
MARTRDLWKDPARRGHGKRWLAVWAGPGGREQTKAFAKKSDADRYGAAQETDATRGTYLDPRLARTTVGQWADDWIRGSLELLAHTAQWPGETYSPGAMAANCRRGR